MKLTLVRDTFDSDATIGKLSIDGAFFCDTLEDVVRASGVKVPHKTAIPCGTYRVVIDYSVRFNRLMPHILDVPDFEGIRFHWGNKPEDTDGCPLVGHRTKRKDWVQGSRATFDMLFGRLMAAFVRKEGIIVTVIGKPKEIPS